METAIRNVVQLRKTSRYEKACVFCVSNHEVRCSVGINIRKSNIYTQNSLHKGFVSGIETHNLSLCLQAHSLISQSSHLKNCVSFYRAWTR